MSKLRAHSGLGRFHRTPLVTKKCWKCESTLHTSINCNTTPRTPIGARSTPRRVDRTTGRVDEPTAEEREYMRRVVDEMPCSALGMPGHAECRGIKVAHHAGRHPYGVKSSHYETICLCWAAHDELHADPGNGWTRASGLDGDGVRRFEDRAIALTQRTLNYQGD